MIDIIREKLKTEMKAHNTLKVKVLRDIINNIGIVGNGKDVTEDQFISIIKKLINQNNEEISLRAGNDQYIENVATLHAENVFLSEFLPVFLTAEAITNLITSNQVIFDKIKAAKNAGAAIGVAMGYLKSHGKVEGETVKEVINSLRPKVE